MDIYHYILIGIIWIAYGLYNLYGMMGESWDNLDHWFKGVIAVILAPLFLIVRMIAGVLDNDFWN